MIFVLFMNGMWIWTSLLFSLLIKFIFKCTLIWSANGVCFNWKNWEFFESGMFNLLIIVMSGANRENYRVTVPSLLWQWWVSSAFRGCRSLGQWKIGQHGKWFWLWLKQHLGVVASSLEGTYSYIKHTLSLSHLSSIYLFILIVNLKYGASSLQFNGSKNIYANICKYIGV